MSSFDDIYVKCPYFYNFDKKDIRCEGLCGDSTIITRFTRRRDMENFAEGFCYKYPNECMVSRALDKKYEVRGNGKNV